jgi:nucleoside-diphosphate-sugar epimerase
MRIFVTGATGWIGSAVVPELINYGHEVVGLARSTESENKLKKIGAGVFKGNIENLESLRTAASNSDGVIHLAFLHDFSRMKEAIKIDANAIQAMGSVLEGSGKPFLIASGTPFIPNKTATEEDKPATTGPMAARGATEQIMLELANKAVRTAIIRLPRSVHGDGDHGFMARLIDIARQKGVSGYVGDGSNRWPAVHVLDAANLIRLAIEKAPAGSVLHAVGDEGVPTLDFVTIIGNHLQIPTKSVTPEDLGLLGIIQSSDMPASSKITQQLMGWEPIQSGLIDDLDNGHYFD